MIVVPANASVFDAFSKVASEHSGRPFLHAPASSTEQYATGAISYSYTEAAREIEHLRSAYSALGTSPEDRVALAFDSRLDVYLHLLALNSLGASLVPLNMMGSDAELRYVIEHSDARLIVPAPEYAERLDSVVSTMPDRRVITPAAMNERAAPPEVTSQASTEAALLYTSGTTGKPKGCMLSNEYFLTMGRWYNSLKGYCQLASTDRLLTPLPPNHMNALCTSFMGMLLCGGCVIQLDRFHPSSWWQTVRDEQATIIHYLGVMPAILLTMPTGPDDDFSDQLKFGFGAGSDPRHQQVFEERFGFPLIEAWAMTETGSGGVTIADQEPRHVGHRCVGKPVETMAYRIVDELDADVAAGEPGELLVRSKGDKPRQGFFSGYYKDEAATEEGWAGGWWHTGDVVRVGPDESLFFVDRRKNVIRRSGENIAAVEVEAALLSCTLVGNCAVAPVPDEIRGDEVFAFVVGSDSAANDKQTAREIFDHCLHKLNYFKAPGYIAFIEELPLTASQKVKRADVKQLAAACVDSGDCVDFRSFKKRIRTG